jgi:ketosteroid isomerase-like protein
VTNDAAKAEILGLIRSVFEAVTRHDVEAVLAILHPDTTVWDYRTPGMVRGHDHHRQVLNAGQANMTDRGPPTFTVEDPIIDVWGDTAVARFYLSYEYKPPNPVSGRVRITDVFRRSGGRWLRMHHHEGVEPPAR